MEAIVFIRENCKEYPGHIDYELVDEYGHNYDYYYSRNIAPGKIEQNKNKHIYNLTRDETFPFIDTINNGFYSLTIVNKNDNQKTVVIDYDIDNKYCKLDFQNCKVIINSNINICSLYCNDLIVNGKLKVENLHNKQFLDSYDNINVEILSLKDVLKVDKPININCSVKYLYLSNMKFKNKIDITVDNVEYLFLQYCKNIIINNKNKINNVNLWFVQKCSVVNYETEYFSCRNCSQVQEELIINTKNLELRNTNIKTLETNANICKIYTCPLDVINGNNIKELSVETCNKLNEINCLNLEKLNIKFGKPFIINCPKLKEVYSHFAKNINIDIDKLKEMKIKFKIKTTDRKLKKQFKEYE